MNRILHYLNPARFVELRYQILCIAMNAALSAFMMYYPTTQFFTNDTLPQLLPLTPDNAETIGIASKSIVVETGLFLENFLEADFNKNNFVCTASVWFTFDPALVSLDTIGQFSFEKADLLSVSKPETKFIEKKLFAQFRAKLKFSGNFNYRNYPVDDHSLFLTLTNKSVSPKEFIFASHGSNFGLSPNIRFHGWREVSRTVFPGYIQTQLDPHNKKTTAYNPAVLYVVNYVTSGMKEIFVLCLPLFFVLFLALMTLSLESDDFKKNGLRVTLSIANLTALIGYRFIIENMSPKANYFMLSDHIFNLFLAMVFCIFFFNLATFQEATARLRGSLIIAIHTVFLSTLYYLLIYWIYH